DLSNQRRAPNVISDETKEAAKPGRHPEPPLMIFQQVMNDVIRQSITFGVVVNVAIGPKSKKSAGGGHPQRTAVVFQQVIYINLGWLLAGHSHIHGQEFVKIVVPFQAVEVFQSSAPDGSASVLVEYIDGPVLAVLGFRHDDTEHRGGLRFVVSVNDAPRRLPSPYEQGA